jgi:hypothetical protein
MVLDSSELTPVPGLRGRRRHGRKLSAYPFLFLKTENNPLSFFALTIIVQMPSLHNKRVFAHYHGT